MKDLPESSNTKLLNIQQAANFLKVSPQTLRRWEQRGVLVPQRTSGNQRRYDIADLTAFKQDKKRFTEAAASVSPAAPQTPVTSVNETESHNNLPTPSQQVDNLEDESPALDAGSVVSAPVTIQAAQVKPTQEVTVQVGKVPFYRGRIGSPLPRAMAFIFFGIILLGGVLIAGMIAAPSLKDMLTGKSGSGNEAQVTEETASGSFAAVKDVKNFIFRVNVDSFFGKEATFEDVVTLKSDLTVDGEAVFNSGLRTNNQNGDFGTGIVIASNIPEVFVQSLTAGSGVTITGTASNPIISASNATSITAGDGISVSGSTVSNADRGSSQNIFKKILVSGQSDIEADGNGDSLTFVAGSGVTLTTDASGDSLTISATGGGTSSQWTTSGNDIYYTTGNVGIGTTTPASALDIDGDFTLSGGATLTNFISCSALETDGSGVLTCGTDDGGATGIINVEEGDAVVSNTAGTIDFLGADFILTESPSGEVNVALDYASSNIVRSNQNETISGNWTFNGTLTLASLTRGVDTITDFTGTGLQVVGNALETTLGTSVDLSSEITGVLGLANGGTSKNLTAVNGGIVYSDADSFEILAAGNSGQILQSGGSGPPTWVDASSVGVNYWQRNSGTLAPLTPSDSLVLGGGTSTGHLFAASGSKVGKALVALDETGGQDIFTASAGGTTRFTIANNGTLTTAYSTGILHSNASGVLSSSAVNLASGDVTGILGVANGGTGVNGSGATNGQLLIGNGSGYTLAALGEGEGIDISNGAGSITIAGEDASDTNKGIASFTTTNFTVSSGAVSITNNTIGDTQLEYNTGQHLTTASSPTFTGLTLSGTLDANGQVDLGDGADAITLSGTTIGLTSNGPGNDITFVSADDISFDDAQLSAPITLTDAATSISGGYTGIIDAINAALAAAGGAGGGAWTLSSGKIYPTTIANQVGIGTTTGANIESSFYVTRNLGSGALGKALTILNQTENQDIFTASASGTTRFTIANNGTLTTSYSTGLLHSNASGVISSSAVDLASADVTGVLPVLNGGTGASSLTDLIALTTMTTGNYVQSISVGNGLAISNAAGEGSTHTISLDVTTTGETSTLSSNSGLETAADGLSLLRGCADGELLKWNDTTDLWECATDDGGATGIINVEENDVLVSNTAGTLDYLGTDFALTESPSGEVNVAIDYANSKIVRSDQNETISGIWNFANQLGIGTTSPVGKLHVTGTQTGKALTILNETGGQDIFTASSAGITRFVIANDGNVGIGTTSPEAKLDLVFTDSSATGGTSYGQRLTVTDDGAVTIGSDTTYGQYIDFNRSGVTTGVDGLHIYGQYINASSSADLGISGEFYGSGINVSGSGTSVGGMLVSVATNPDAVDTGILYGAKMEVTHQGTTAMGSIYGQNVSVVQNSDAGNVDAAFGSALFVMADNHIENAYAVSASVGTGITGSLTNGYGVMISEPSELFGSRIDNVYGLYITDQSAHGTTSSYNIYSAGSGINYFGGNVGIGVSDPEEKLDIDGNILVGANSTMDTRTGGTLAIGGTTQTGLTLGRPGASTSIAGTTIGLTSNGATNDISFVSADDISFDDAQLSAPITLTDAATSISGGYTGIIDAINAALAASGGGAGSVWTLSSGKVYPTTIANQVGIGTTTGANIESSFYVTRNLASGALGKALGIFNQTENQDIFTASASGTTRFTIANNGNLTTAYSTGILHSNASGVISSSAVNLASGDVTGTLGVGNGGTGATSLTDLIALTTMTTGNYVQSLSVGNGLSISNAAGEGSTHTISLDVTTSGETSTLSSNSGLETAADGLSLLRGCDDMQLLKWDDTNDLWECAADDGGATGIINVEENNVLLTSSASTLDFLGNDFILTDSPAGEVNISIDYPNSKIVRSDQNESITGIWNFSNQLGVGTTSPVGKLHVTGAQTGKALVILNETGDQDIFTASSAGSTRFVISNAGNVGIGTNAPGQELDVNGDILVGANSTIDTRTTGTLAIGGTTQNGLTLGRAGASTSIAGTSVSLTSNSGNDISFTSADDISFDDAQLSAPITLTDAATSISGGYTGIIDAINAALAASGGGAGSVWTLSSGKVYPTTISNQVGIGTTTGANIESSFYVTRDLASGALGKALGIFNQTENQDIFTASASGATRFTISNSGNIGFSGNTAFTNTLTSAASANRTYTFPDATGVICLDTGNCAGAGGGITGSGTATQVAFFTGGGTISSDANLYYNSTSKLLGLGTSSPNAQLTVTRPIALGATGKALAIFDQVENQDVLTASASGTTVFTVDRSGSLTAATNETINGIDISSGSISDVVNLTINNGGDLTIGSIGLNDIGSSNTDSGASLVGVFDEFTNSNSTTVQDVLDDLDAAISVVGGANPWTISSGKIYPTTISNQVGIGTTTGANILSSFFVTRDLASGALGKALAIFNQTENQDLLTASASGTTMFTVSNTGAVAIEGALSDLTGATLDVNDNLDVSGTLTAGTGNAFQVAATGDITTVTNETINGIDINAGTVTDVVNLTINSGGDLTIGSIGLNDLGTDNITSGASLIGTFDEFANSNSTTVQDVLDDLDAAISGVAGANPWTLSSGKVYPTTISNLVGIGTTTGANITSSLYVTHDLASGATGKALAVFNQTENQDIFTASASGTTRFVIANNGNVGIGTNSPIAKFQLAGDYNAAFPSDDDGAQMLITGATNPTKRLQLGVDTTDDYGFIRAANQGVEILPLILQPNQGNVGIGTIAPGSVLTVDGGVAQFSGDTQASSGVGVEIGYGGIADHGHLTVYDRDGESYKNMLYNAAEHVFWVSEVEKMRLDTNGNLAVEGSLSDMTGATLDVNDNLDVSGTLTAGTGNAFQVAATGDITTVTNETINGIDINAGTVTDVVNLTINGGGDLTIGTIGLNDVGTNNTDSGASLVGVFDEFTNSSSTTVQDVLDDLDAAISGVGSANPWTLSSGKVYPTTISNQVGIGTTTGANIVSSFFVTRDLASGALGKALAIFDQTENQNVITASSSGATVFNVTNTGGIEGADLVLGLNDASATITTQDTNEVLTIDPNGSGAIQFHSSSNTIDASGNLVLAGDLRLNGNDIADSGNTTRITLGSTMTLTATTLNVTGNLDIDGSGTHDIAGTLNLSGNALTSSADLTITPAGGQVILPNAVTLNVGGISNVAYNAFADSATSVDIADGDSDLFIGDELEVNGNARFDGGIDSNGQVTIADTQVDFDGASTILNFTGATTLTPGGAMILGATGQTATLQGTSVSITSNSGADITLVSADDISFDDAQLSAPITLTDAATSISGGYTGIIDAINAALTASGGGTGSVWTLSSGKVYPTTISNLVGIGTTTGANITSSLFVTHDLASGATGKALTIFDQTENQDIIAASASGVSKFRVDSSGQLLAPFWSAGYGLAANAAIGLGWNRNVGTGEILDSGRYAFQWTRAANADFLKLQVFQGNGSEVTDRAIVVDSAGNVGLGITNPGRQLHLYSSNAGLAIQDSNPGGKTYTLTNLSSGDGSMGLYDGTAFRWMVNTNGNLGIGTTAPGAELHVSRPLALGANGKALAIFDQIENQDILTASASGTTVFTLGRSGNASLVNSGTSNIDFNLASSGDFTISDNGTPFATFTDGGALTVDTLTLDGAVLSASGALTLTPGGAMILGSAGQTATLQGTSVSITSNSGADITFVSADDISFDDAQLSAPITLTDVDSALPNSNTGIVDAINDAYAAATGGAGSVWTLSSGKVYPTTISNQVGIGTTTGANVESSFYLTRNLASGALGKALAIFNQTENQDIFTASASGATRLTLTNGGNLLPGTNDAQVLGSDTLRWQDLYLGPDSLHIGTSTSDEYTINYDTTNNRLGFNVNGSGDPEIAMDSSGNLLLVDNQIRYGTLGSEDLSVSRVLQDEFIWSNGASLRVQSLASNTRTDFVVAPSGSNNNANIFISRTSDLLNNTEVLALGTDINGVSGLFGLQSLQSGSGTLRPFAYYMGSNEVMRYETNGNIGIGTTAPGAVLDVARTFSSATAGTEYGSRLTISDNGAVNSGSDITYGQYIDLRRSGASGGSNEAYGQAIVATGSGTLDYLVGSSISVSGNGDTISALTAFANTNPDDSITNDLRGIFSQATNNATGFIGNIYGIDTTAENSQGYASNGFGISSRAYNFSGYMDNAYAGYFKIENGGAGVMGSGYGVYVATPDGGGINVASNYGLYIADQAGQAVSSYNLYSAGAGRNYFSGNVGIGITNPTSQLSVTRPLSLGATGKALAIFNQIENQDIFTASSSGTARFTITNAGGIKLGTSEGSASDCLKSQGPGAAAIWGSCSGSGDWTNSSGTIYPTTISTRLGVGTTTAGNIISSFYLTHDLASGATGKALAIFNQTENQDIFTASASGITKFVINNAGNVGIGQTNPLLASLDIKDNASLATEGSEKITSSNDRDFSTDTGNWTTDTPPDWKVDVADSNVAAKDAPGGEGIFSLSNSALDSPPVPGNTYEITFDYTTTASSSGQFTMRFGGNWNNPIGQEVDYGRNSQVQIITAVNTDPLSIVASDNWYGTIDNISVKQITGSSIALRLESSDGTDSPVEIRAGGSGQANIYMGTDSGLLNTTGFGNNAFGSLALSSNTTGSSNNAFGESSLVSNTTGFGNNAVGRFSLWKNTGGNNNNAFGLNALQDNIAGSNNTALGGYTLADNIVGNDNVAVGSAALTQNTVGNYNTAVGTESLVGLVTGSNNTALGRQAGYAATGSNNVFLGYQSGWNGGSGSGNIFLGYQAGYNETGSNKLYIDNSDTSSPLIWGDFSTDVLSVNGNVGIGTTTPSTFKLEVAGNIGPSANDTYDLGSDTRRFKDLYLGPDTLHIGTSTSDEYTIGYDTTNNRLGFNVNGSGNPEFVMDSNGNLGIGVTNPAGNLEVYGTGSTFLMGDSQVAHGATNIAPTDAYLKLGIATGGAGGAMIAGYSEDTNPGLILRGTNSGTSPTVSFIASKLSGANIGSLGATDKAFTFDNYGSATLMVIQGNGNVGIGTGAYTPLHKLHIDGTTNQTALMAINGDGNQALFTASASGVTKFLIDNAGNVGIGLTSTLASLDIKGTSSLATAGSEKITSSNDRDFSTSTGNWTGTGWSVDIGNSNLAAKDTPGANVFTLNNAALDAAAANGNTYQVTFSYTTAASSSGTIRPSFGSTNGITMGQGASQSEPGKKQTITATGTGALTFTPSSGWYGTIDDVSVVQVTNSNIALRLESSNGTGTPIEFRTGGHNLSNIFMGSSAGRSTTSGGNSNIAIGDEALRDNTTGDGNTATGLWAMRTSTTGIENSAYGFIALSNNISGYENAAFGTRALENNRIGGDNSAFGAYAMNANTIGEFNSAFGAFALDANTTGLKNVAFGYGAGGGISTGSNNITIGASAGENIDTGSNNIIIGYDIDAPSGTGNNQLNIGNLIYGINVDGANGSISTGNIGIGVTSPTAKLDISGDASTSGVLTFRGASNPIIQSLNGKNMYFATSVGGDSGTITRLTLNNNGTFSVGGTNPSNQFEVTRQLAYGATGKALAIFDQIENQDILTASAGGVTKFTISNTGDITTSGTTFNCTDCIDFDDMKDSLTVDAATDLNLSTFNFTIDMDSTGDFSIRDGSTDILAFTDSGAISATPTSGQNYSVTTAGTGDILYSSGDTMLLDAAGVLELNSSGGVISIGNDAVAQNINIGTGGAARTIALGNNSGATGFTFDAGTGNYDFDSLITTGNLMSLGAPSGVTAADGLVGIDLNLQTNYTSTDADITGFSVTLDTLDNTAAAANIFTGMTVTGGTVTGNQASAQPLWEGYEAVIPASTNTNTNATGIIMRGFDVETTANTLTTAEVTTIAGYALSSAGALSHTTAAGTLNFRGTDITLPAATVNITSGAVNVDGARITTGNITNTAGTVTETGLYVDLSASTVARTADTPVLRGMYINPGTSENVVSTIQGVVIDNLTAAANAVETAIAIGSGWDTDINATTSLEVGIGGTNELYLDGDDFSPATSDGNSLGDTDNMWSDLFLASGGVINFNNGNVTLTHSAGTLTLAGATGLSMSSVTTLTCTDCIDFDDMADSMTIDAATDINLGANAFSIDLDSSGDFSIRDVTTDIATFADSGAITFAPTSGQALAINLGGAGDFAVNTNQLYVDTSASRVGIGRTDPETNLSILGDFTSTTDIGLAVRGQNSGSYLSLVQTAVWAWGIGMDESSTSLKFVGDMYPGHAGSTRMTLDQNGNLGIGTTTPNALLDIASATGASTSGILTFRGTTDPSINFLNGENLTFRSSHQGDAALSTKMTILNSGNVGIGITNPSRLLHLSGVNAGLAISDSGGSKTYTFTNLGAADGSMGLYDGTAFRWLVDTNGNMGVGTTSPLHKFQVAGTTNQTALAAINGDGNQDLLTATKSGTTKFLVNRNGDLLVGTVATITAVTDGIIASGGIGSNSFYSLNSNVIANYSSSLLNIGSSSWSTGIQMKTGVDVMRLDNNGNVGIGTTGPGAALDVAKTFTSGTAGTDYGTRLTIADTGAVGSGTDISYGQYIDFSRSGATGGAIAGVGQSITASGSGTTITQMIGNIVTASGFGTIYGESILGRSNADNKTSTDITGAQITGQHFGSTGLTNLYGVQGYAVKVNNGSVTNAYGLYTYISNQAAVGSITNAYGLFIADSIETSTITNDWGVYQQDTQASNYLGGNLGIGTTTPQGQLHVTRPLSAGATGKALVTLDQIENADILTASASGTKRFVLTNAGNVGFFGDSTVISASSSGASNNGSGSIVNALGDSNSMVPNAGFEATNFGSTMPDGWVRPASNSATIQQDTTSAQQGSASIQFTTTSTNQNAAFYSACFPVSLGGTYSFTYFQKSANNGTATVRAWLDSYTSKTNCNNNISPTLSAVSGVNTTTSYAIVTGNVSALATATWGRAHFYVASAQSGANAATNIDGVRLVPSTLTGGMDYAENYPVDPSDVPQPGEIVSIQTDGVKDQVGKSSTYMDQKAIGIVATQPGQILDDGTVPSPKVPVALAGRVPVKVSTAKGPIYAGDYLTTSDIPGVAVKATKSGPTIGKAMENYLGAEIGTVTAFVNISSIYRPELEVTAGGEVTIAKDPELGLDQYMVKVGGEKVEKKGIFSDLFAGNVKAGMIDATDIKVGGRSVKDFLDGLENTTASLSGTLSASDSATIISELQRVNDRAVQTQNEIIAMRNDIDSMKSEVASLSGKFASLEAMNESTNGMLEQLLNGPLFSASGSASTDFSTIEDLNIETAVVGDSLQVLGRTTLKDLGVTGNITAGVLSVNGLEGSINTVGEPLRLQNLGVAGVDILDGKVTIDTAGNVKTVGTISAKEVKAETVKTKKLEVETAASTGSVLTTSAGTVVIEAGDTSVDVSTSALTTKSLVFVTPDGKAIAVGTKKKDADTFTIILPAPQTTDVKVNWWIVN